MSITGFKSTDIESRAKVEPVTATKFGYKRHGLDVNAISSIYSLGAVTLSSGTTTSIAVMSPAFTVREGDMLDKSGVRSEIVSVSGNNYTLGRSISGLGSGDSVTIYRPIYLLADSTGAITAVLSGTSSVNVAQYGGVATSLGQKAEASSIPTVLATEQDTAKVDADSGYNFNLVGVTYTDINGTAHRAWPCLGDSTSYYVPAVALQVADPTSGIPISPAIRPSTPNSADNGLVTRSILYGINGGTPTKVNVDSSGDVQTDVLSLPFATLSAATVPARGKIAGTSLTGSYQNLLAMGGNARAVTLMNSTDQNVIISFDGGTTDNIELDAYESTTQDYASLGVYLTSGTIQAKHGGTLPKVGSIRASVVR